MDNRKIRISEESYETNPKYIQRPSMGSLTNMD